MPKRAIAKNRGNNAFSGTDGKMEFAVGDVQET